MKVETLKNLREAKADLTKRFAALERERESVRADIQALARIIVRYEGREQSLFSEESHSSTGSEFKGATMRKSILTILGRNFPNPKRARAIAQELIDGGFETKKNAIQLSNAVFANLHYLMGKGEVGRVGDGLYKTKLDSAISVAG